MRNGLWLIPATAIAVLIFSSPWWYKKTWPNGGSMVAIRAPMPGIGMAPKAKLGTGSRNSRQTSLQPSPTPANEALDFILSLAADSRKLWSFIFLSGCRISRGPLLLTNTIYGQLAFAQKGTKNTGCINCRIRMWTICYSSTNPQGDGVETGANFLPLIIRRFCN